VTKTAHPYKIEMLMRTRGRASFATLPFGPQAAQGVGREEWHPDQQGRWIEGGRYELTIPYADATEITMDVMRHSDQVRVVEPQSLAAHIGAALQRTAAAHVGRSGSVRAPRARASGVQKDSHEA